MALIEERHRDELRNRIEGRVWAALEEFLEENPAACRCRDCILDTAAIALNRIPPQYRVYDFHGDRPADDAALERLVAEAVRAASLQVAKSPHHL